MTPGVRRVRGRAGVTRLLILAAGLTACSTAAPPPPAAEPAPTELTLASFTAEQADRGERVFTSVCSVCHGRNEFRGPIFALTWRVEPVGNLFQHISTTMPQDQPGSLSPDEYAAVVAYLLRLNGRTPGDHELPADAELLSVLRW